MTLPFKERIALEKDSFPSLNPKYVERIEKSTLGSIVRVREKMGRPLTEEEMRLIHSMT